MKIGIISDTHNLLREEVEKELKGCDAILHGGDISQQSILDQLEAMAPVRVVRGNNDKEWAEHLPESLDFEMAGLRFFMTHKKKDIPKDVSSYDLVIFGHSHQYSEIWVGMKKKTLLLNPGSCGPRRFIQPITMAILTVDGEEWTVKRLDIQHTVKETTAAIGPDIRKQIELVVRETQKGRGPEDIAKRYGMDAAVAEQIARLYVTHPGVTTDGIMTKMGL